jgi:MerR family transcriptional regulator, light-induced transcriptional regulator
MSFFTIKDLENLSGIKAHTIRIWEQRYDFLKPKRTKTNIRYYDNEELKRVLNVALLNKYGYKVSHINRMSENEIHNRVLSLNSTEALQERYIAHLIQCMINLDTEGIDELLNQYILNRGIEKTITHLVFPFLERIGILWSTNHINPAQEHLITNIIRQKLIVGIENIVFRPRTDYGVLLFLPEGEYHELGLLYMQFLLKAKGVHTYYLGANVPLNDAEYVFQQKNIQYLFLHLTSLPNNFNLDNYIRQLSLLFRNAAVLVSGQPIQGYEKNVSDNIRLKKSLREVMDFIISL